MKQLTKKTRGTVSHYGDESFEFTPYGKGEPVYEHSYKVGEATIGKTKGAGKQNFVAKTPFALGLVVGFVMNRWTRCGISFNRMQIDTQNLTVKLRVLRNQELNDMQVEWV